MLIRKSLKYPKRYPVKQFGKYVVIAVPQELADPVLDLIERRNYKIDLVGVKLGGSYDGDAHFNVRSKGIIFDGTWLRYDPDLPG